MNRSSLFTKRSSDDFIGSADSYSANDYGGFGGNDYNDDDDDDDFDDHAGITLPLNNAPLSISPESHVSRSFEPRVSNEAPSDDLLDALCSGNLMPSQSSFSFFSGESIQKLITGNQWAGSSHWKSARKANSKGNAQPSSRKNTKKKQNVSKNKLASTQFVDLYSPIQGLACSAIQSKKKVKLVSPLANLKMNTDKFILPIDAGITVDQLSSFFLRPNIMFSTGREPHEFYRCGTSCAFLYHISLLKESLTLQP